MMTIHSQARQQVSASYEYALVHCSIIITMKKRNQRIHDYQTMSKRILCGRFAEHLKKNFAVGDQDNNLILYNLVGPKPIAVLNPQTNNNVSSLTALTFTQSDDQIVVGHSRGSINVWDLNSLKINFCLKGHTVEVCSLYSDRKHHNIIASGSSDTNAKIWDLRTKNCQGNIKNHNKKVTALSISSESRILATGGQDGVVQTFDLKMMKPLFQYQIGAPVLSLDCRHDLLAVGSMDRLARVFELDAPFSQVGSTKSETMPISSVVFWKNRHLFTAGTDNLKLWDLQKDFMMTDNIQTNSKGILHMVVSSDKIQQIAFSGGGLSYHQCFLSEVSFDGPYSFSNPSIACERQQKVDDAIERNNKIRRGNSTNPMSLITNQKTKQMMAKRSDSIAKQLTGVTENITDALSSIKRVSEQFNNRKVQVQQLREIMGDQHVKFLKIMGQRAKSIQTILDLWRKGNVKTLIQMVKTVDIYVASDVLGQILKPSTISISTEFGLIIAEKAKEMINCKHMTIIKMGLDYLLQVVTLFKDDMIKLKTFGADKGVDLAREERLRRFDLLIEQYVEIYQSHRLKRLSEKKQQTSKLAQKLQEELMLIFKKVFGNELPF